MPIPVVVRTQIATYRLQLRGGVDFEGATALVDYLAELGVSHLYLSPIFTAMRDSEHGYDVVDPARIDPALGGEEGFRGLCAALSERGMGLVLDVVPNHMAIGSNNRWWWDVLEHGSASRYASYFDVDWNPPEERLRDVVLLPLLGNHYGRVLESGDLRIVRDGSTFTLRYHDHAYPVAPPSLPLILEEAARIAGSDELAFISESYARLPRTAAADAGNGRYRDEDVLAGLLRRLLTEQPHVGGAIDEVVAATNRSLDRLDALLGAQHYRLAYWRTGGRELGYRRFFDIDTMAALRIEDDAVFADTHALALRLVADGCADGLRIDHIDGLRRPGEYLRKLRAAAPATWLLVEKVLAPDEPLRASWPVAGSTGYDFLNHVGGLFIDPAAEPAFDSLYRELTGEARSWREIAREAKAEVIRDLLASDIARLAQLLLDVCERRPRYRDYTRHDLSEAIGALLVGLDVYRTYVDPGDGAVGDQDARRVRAAVANAITDDPSVDTDLLDFIGSVLLLEATGDQEREFVSRFQQVSGPVMAKGIEDTAFYRYNRLVSLCEVGNEPTRFGVSPERFHAECAVAAAEHPRRMITTSTHDTKRSEDVRARLAVLTERPDEWAAAVSAWRHDHRRRDAGLLIDPATEYAFHQNLVGAWPIDAARMSAYMEKATKEAKLHTSWIDPDEDYDARVRGFVETSLADESFVSKVCEFVASLEPAATVNALAQKLIALTAPGIPDLYQGTELWDLSLVDPDNRRPVDFARRAELLRDAGVAKSSGVLGVDDGCAKLRIVKRALKARRERPELFAPGASYRALEAEGEHAHRVIAFIRGGGALTVAPRLTSRMGAWGDTAVTLPGGAWTDVLADRKHDGGRVLASDVLRDFPVALLVLDPAK